MVAICWLQAYFRSQSSLNVSLFVICTSVCTNFIKYRIIGSSTRSSRFSAVLIAYESKVFEAESVKYIGPLHSFIRHVHNSCLRAYYRHTYHRWFSEAVQAGRRRCFLLLILVVSLCLFVFWFRSPLTLRYRCSLCRASPLSFTYRGLLRSLPCLFASV